MKNFTNGPSRSAPSVRKRWKVLVNEKNCRNFPDSCDTTTKPRHGDQEKQRDRSQADAIAASGAGPALPACTQTRVPPIGRRAPRCPCSARPAQSDADAAAIHPSSRAGRRSHVRARMNENAATRTMKKQKPLVEDVESDR